MRIGEFLFAALLLLVIGQSVEAQRRAFTIYLAGDSTMAEKPPEKRPETDWGEMLGKFFPEGKVTIDNRAQNGRSTRTFISEGRWQANHRCAAAGRLRFHSVWTQR